MDSSTRTKEFCQKISQRLALKSHEGFALFVRITSELISVPEDEFFFDFVHQLSDWLKQMKPIKGGAEGDVTLSSSSHPHHFTQSK